MLLPPDFWWSHVPYNKRKGETSMLLIWSGPDGEDIYDNFNLPPHQANDVDYVLQRFEEFCKPICNFRAARFKFTKVCQRQNENIDTFYNRILKLAHQCEFSDVNERLIDAIILEQIVSRLRINFFRLPTRLVYSNASPYADTTKAWVCTFNRFGLTSR